jgi:4-alpha-glucanotransferase
LTRRAAGIVLHPTSLPGAFAIGDLGPQAERFLDWAAAAGQSIWQVLPLGPTGHGNSPYAGVSAHAGNPLLISPECLRDEGFLPSTALVGRDVASVGDRVRKKASGVGDRVDFAAAFREKSALLHASWAHIRGAGSPGLRAEFEAFREDPEREPWLADWTLYDALKEAHGGAPWTAWEPALRRREPTALDRAARSLRDAIDYRAYLQFLFFRQWDRVRAQARERGVAILGDVAIYVALDSVEVWARPDLFRLDAEGGPIAVAGVPPDYFSATGQLWGNPLYDWPRHEAEGYAWWIGRVRSELRRLDLLRLDHFRAFASYWSVPAGAETAAVGRWEPGPGLSFFDALRRALGGPPSIADLPLVAEDLGIITDDVRELLRATGLPGMRVLHFGFDSSGSEHAPHLIPEHCVAYTGTHDNDTTRGWFDSLGGEERRRVLEAIGDDGGDVAWSMIRALYATAAERVLVPIQDVLDLGTEARMNTPSVPEGNWEFRMAPDTWARAGEERLRAAAVATGRA